MRQIEQRQDSNKTVDCLPEQQSKLLYCILNILAMNDLLIPFIQDLISGTISGIGLCVSGYVFDTIKVRMQMNPTIKLQTVLQQIQKEGYSHLFSGIYYPLLTVPLVSAIVFASYEGYKKLRGKDELTFIDGIQNGAFAGLINTVIVSPVEMVKCIMQNDHQSNYRNSSECAKQILKIQGIRGLYRGTFSTAIREILAYSGQFAAYEYLKGRLVKDRHQHLELMQGIMVGIVSGVFCWILSYPPDIVKTMLQVEKKGKFARHWLIPDGGFFSCVTYIKKNQGWKGFWIGIQPCLARAVISNAVALPLYERSRAYCHDYQM